MAGIESEFGLISDDDIAILLHIAYRDRIEMMSS